MEVRPETAADGVNSGLPCYVRSSATPSLHCFWGNSSHRFAFLNSSLERSSTHQTLRCVVQSAAPDAFPEAQLLSNLRSSCVVTKTGPARSIKFWRLCLKAGL